MAKIPKTNITTDIVRDTLNGAGGSVTNAMGTFYSSSANINPSSKHKPVRRKLDFCQDYDSNKANYVADWWKAENKLCGYNLDNATASSWTALVGKYDGDANGWVYELPIGGEAQPLRLGDFGGYNPDALPLSWGFLAPKTVYKSQTTATIAINLPDKNDDYLTWWDFDTFKDYYFGVLIYHSNGYRRVTATTTISRGGSTVTFNPSLLTAGRTYTVYPFISSVAYTESEGDKSMQLYTIPHAEPQMMAVKESILQIFPAAGKVNATETIEWSIQVKNTTTSAVTLNTNTIRIYKNRSGTAESGDYSETIANTSVAANTTKVIASGVATVGYRTNFDFATTPLYVEVSLGGGQYVATGMVAEDLSAGGGGLT